MQIQVGRKRSLMSCRDQRATREALPPALAVCAAHLELRMPILGITMPNMGKSLEHPMHRPPVGLADALFPSTRGRVLACLFGQPGRSFYATELMRLTGGGSGAV